MPHAAYSISIKCIVGGNMAVPISDNHLHFYHRDIYRPITMGHSYFKGPCYLAVQGCIRAILL